MRAREETGNRKDRATEAEAERENRRERRWLPVGCKHTRTLPPLLLLLTPRDSKRRRRERRRDASDDVIDYDDDDGISDARLQELRLQRREFPGVHISRRREREKRGKDVDRRRHQQRQQERRQDGDGREARKREGDRTRQ